MNISEETVKAAAVALCVSGYERDFKRKVEYPQELWAGYVEEERTEILADTRAALEAAAPLIATQALRDAASTIYDYIKAGADDPVSPDETAVWLLARAATIEAGN